MRTPRDNWKIPGWKLVPIHETVLPYGAVILDTPEKAAAFWGASVKDDPRLNPGTESFAVIHLNSRRRVIGFHIAATGTLDTILVHPREVFRHAIVSNASAVVLMHNHPSGDPTPSEADVKVTRDLIRAGQLMKLDVLDHVIIAQPTPENPKGYTSLRELGYFYT